MVVDASHQMRLIKLVDPWRKTLRYMAITEYFSYDGAVFTVDQRIVIGLPRAGFGQFDAEFIQQFDDPFADVPRAVIGMKANDVKGKCL